jgi:hypothetical protein
LGVHCGCPTVSSSVSGGLVPTSSCVCFGGAPIQVCPSQAHLPSTVPWGSHFAVIGGACCKRVFVYVYACVSFCADLGAGDNYSGEVTVGFTAAAVVPEAGLFLDFTGHTISALTVRCLACWAWV